MSTALWIGLAVALLSAFDAIALGRNLTRSLVAGTIFVAALGFALLVAGAGYLSLVVVILAALELAVLQVFGWMLVDVDRDHLPPTDRPTWIARGLAFLLFGGGLLLLVIAAVTTGEFEIVGQRVAAAAPEEIGALLFGPLRDATILVGLAIAASLLAALLLLQDDGQKG
jgi:NADH:ubiquinone oxidoreductase subunit 6 (subunit J)